MNQSFTPLCTDWKAEVARLAKLHPIAYEQERKAAAERLSIDRIGVLDDAVRKARGDAEASGAARGQGHELNLNPPEPWGEPVDGGRWLDLAGRLIMRHVWLPPEAAHVAAMWLLHTYVFDRGRHTPRLAITSPAPRCGKTTLLDLLGLIACKALPAANITAAALYRVVERAKPSLMLDEADTYLKDQEDLRGILNAGHKRGGQAIRCIGEGNSLDVGAFDVFAPVAIAAIGALPRTLSDRSITIAMRRAGTAERPRPVDRETEAEAATLARMAARWAQDHGDKLGDIDPAMPDHLFNREADKFRVLFAIATEIGGDCHSRLAEAVRQLAGEDEDDSLGTVLLQDLRDAFDKRAPLITGEAWRVTSEELVQDLLGRQDRPWPEMPFSNKPLTTNKLARLLKPYKVKPRKWRGPVGIVYGYHYTDLAEAFASYAVDTPRPDPAGGADS